MASIWYKSESGKDADVNSRQEAVKFLAKKIIEEADKSPEWIDELMESYGFIVVDNDDTLSCPIENDWSVPLALLPHKESTGRYDERCTHCGHYDVCYI